MALVSMCFPLVNKPTNKTSYYGMDAGGGVKAGEESCSDTSRVLR